MPQSIICEEVLQHGKGENKHRLHEITVPSYNEPGWYTTIGAFNAFSSGKRKGVSKVDEEFARSGCAWGPNSLYILKFKDAWLDEQARYQRAHLKCGGEGSMFKEAFEGADDPAITTLEQIPKIQHESLKAFFASIGFDQKTRRYLDPQGSPLKYSVLDPDKVRRAPTKTLPGPQI